MSYMPGAMEKGYSEQPGRVRDDNIDDEKEDRERDVVSAAQYGLIDT